MGTAALNEFRIYAPPLQKSYGLNEDGTLTITGIASTTNKDLDGDIVTPDALESLREQVIGLNLHLDHNHHYDGGIGVITDAKLEEDSLRITAVVLPEYAKGIKERLDLGMNFGFSIGGIPVRDTLHPSTINDFNLLELSLTLLPANWDTFGTVESKGIVKSKCLTGACHYILKKNNEEFMDKKDLDNPEGLSDEVKQEFIDIVNEAVYNVKPQIVEDVTNAVKDDLANLVEDTVTRVVSDLVPPKEAAEADEVDETKEVTEEEEIVTDESDSIVEEEDCIDETKEVTDDPIDGVERVDSADYVDETKEVNDDPIDGVERVDSADYVDETKETDGAAGEASEPAEDDTEEKDIYEEEPAVEESTDAPKVIVDIKSLKEDVIKELKTKSFKEDIVKEVTAAQAIDVKSLKEDIVKELVDAVTSKSYVDKIVEATESRLYKNLDGKRQSKNGTVEGSKLKSYQKSKTKDTDFKFLGNEKRDELGRNKKYL